MKSAIFLCFVLFCCLNVIRPAPAEVEEPESSLEEIFKRYYSGGYGRGYWGYGGYGYGGSGAGNVFVRQRL